MGIVRAVAARAILLAFGLLLFVLAGEVALRAIYRDGGTRTLGGPGGQPFDHSTIDGELRGRRDVGPKRPGVPRVMVVGDSITYGLGVHDWRQTWPERLAQALERDGRPHEFAVFALPGSEINHHVTVMRDWGGRTNPDVVIYQWYVNDIEVVSHRPDFRHWWQRQPWHRSLRGASYLYYVLDHRLGQVMTPPQRNYVRYLQTEFAPGTLEWAEFEREFHEFAVLASPASRRILMLYPQVPFRERYPLQTIHDRMRVLAGKHALEIPPQAWIRSAGTLVMAADAPRGSVLQVPSDFRNVVVETRSYLFNPGPTDFVVSLSTSTPGADIATVVLVDPANGAVVASAPLRADRSGSVTDVPLRLTIAGERSERLVLRVVSAGGGAWALANITLPVDYGFEVLDLATTLNTFDTHASAFDSHPNERTHEAMADALYQVLSNPR